MALIDDYNQAVENPQFAQKVAICVSKTVMTALAAANPPADQLALGKRFLLAPDAEAHRYLLPVAARIVINAGSFTNDANIQTAVDQVLAANLKAAIG